MGEVTSYTKEGIDDILLDVLAGSNPLAIIDGSVVDNDVVLERGNGSLITLPLGPTTNSMGTVVHGNDPNVARPVGYDVVYWIGTVAPVNATNNDFWTDLDAIPGPDSANSMGVIVHDNDSNVARPDGYDVVHWVGTVAPVNALNNDFWTDSDAVADNLAGSGSEINVKDYGAIGDGVADDTAAIQAACIAAGYPDFRPNAVYFPAGFYNISSTIDRLGALIRGSGSVVGSRFRWVGAAGGTMWTSTGIDAHSGGFEHVSFEWTGNEPAWHIDFSNVAVDQQLVMQHLGFSGGGIKIGGWVNVHWRHIRFDGPKTFAIDIITPSGWTNGPFSFHLDDFTFDDARGVGTCRGLLRIDNSLSDSAQLGAICISNGRVELNTGLSVEQAIVTIKHDGTPPGDECVPIIIDNVEAWTNATPPDLAFVYRDTADTTKHEFVSIQGCKVNSAFVVPTAGTWATTQRRPATVTPSIILAKNAALIERLAVKGSVDLSFDLDGSVLNGRGGRAWNPAAGGIEIGLHGLTAGPSPAFMTVNAAGNRTGGGMRAIDGGLMVGNSVAATGPVGSIVRKIPVYDGDNNLVAYVAGYDGIT